jgi:hypothetical protein
MQGYDSAKDMKKDQASDKKNKGKDSSALTGIGPLGLKAKGVTDERRAKIRKKVESGKLTVEQAMAKEPKPAPAGVLSGSGKPKQDTKKKNDKKPDDKKKNKGGSVLSGKKKK